MISTILIIGGVYIVASYVLMFRSLYRNPGPAGLGWLALPLAPLAGPSLIWQGVKSFIRRIFS